MTATVIAFFNNKGGVGKTSLVYHLAYMFSESGISTIAADLDPQANLTSMFLDEIRLEELWVTDESKNTIYGSVIPLKERLGDFKHIQPISISENLHIIAGDLSLTSFEDELSETWSDCLAGKNAAFRVTSAFSRILQDAASCSNAILILIDLGPNLGALNRAALLATDFVVVPLTPDLFSLQGLRNLGPTLRTWRADWKKRLATRPSEDLDLPEGQMQPIGYIVQQHSTRFDRPVLAYEKWIKRIPKVYSTAVLDDTLSKPSSIDDDPNCLALLRHYRSLMAMAHESRKPIFDLQAADGALGGHIQGVQQAFKDFKILSRKIAERVNIDVTIFN